MASNLTPFDGKDVIKTTIAVTKAGDGLSAALAIEPEELHHGQTVYVVLETTVGKVQFIESSDSPDLLIRQHVLVAGTATIVPEELVRDMIVAQRLKIERARDEAKGIVALDGLDPRPPVDEPGTDAEGFYDPEADIPAPTLSSIAGGRAKKVSGGVKKAGAAKNPK